MSLNRKSFPAASRRRAAAGPARRCAAALLAAALAPATAQAPPVRVLADARLSQAVTSFGAAALDGWVYVYGGHVGRTHAHSAQNHVGTFHRLRLAPAFQIEELPGGPGLQGLALVACRGQLCRVGGMQARNAEGQPADLHSTDACARFDPRAGEWLPLPPLPEPRSSHDAVAVGDAIYVAGGWTLRGKERTWAKTAWRIDLAATEPVWREIAAPGFVRRAGALAVLGDKLWYFGGLEEDGGSSERIDVYDPVADAWQRGPQLRGEGFGIAVLAEGGAVFTSGGDGVVYRLDGGRAEPVARLLVPRFFHRLVAIEPGRLLALGGETRAGHTALVEEIDCDPRATQVQTWRVGLPAGTRNRQGMLVHDGSLLLFGGNRAREQHAFTPQDFAAGACSLSLETFAVSPLPDFPVARQSMAALTVDGAGDGLPAHLALGGFGHDGTAARSHADVFRFDPKAKQWSPVSYALDRPRTQAGAVAHGGRVLVLGGTDYDARRSEAEAFQYPLEVLALDPVRGVTETLAWQLPRARRAFGGAQLDGRYYLVGGMESDFAAVEPCDVLDLATGRWSSIPAPKQHRIAPQLEALGGALYLAGGSAEAPGIERFDVGVARWSTVLDALPIPARHLRLFVHRERLLLLSPGAGEAAEIHVAFVRPGVAPAQAAVEAAATGGTDR